ncbi:MAG: S8 family serine peptidase [Methanobacteriota archaeon]
MKFSKVLALFILLLLSFNVQAGKLSSVLEDRISDLDGEKVRVIVLTQEGPVSQSAVAQTSQVRRSYTLIPGYSAELSGREIQLLSESQFVEKIFLDTPRRLLDPEPVEITPKLQTSVDSIGAGYVRDTLNITGRNITVAVIDTGIDYTHPDLGGCTQGEFLAGNCSRVIGGWDFYYNDPDPMDQHSHGTHVAGIIGANGGVVGVAPEVSFYALMVCRPSNPICWDSDIIAAIDWAVAHNADVISISLGGPYQPNDDVGPLEQAIDEAVRRGVVVSVAAGNMGSGTSTIEHPASSSLAITVGNVDDIGSPRTSDDYISSLSSRGPAAFGRLDPDVSAPGTNIISTVPGGGYWEKSGTSMSAPHVSGAAALLLESDPTLTPSQVRSILIHSAENISGHVFEKGGGEVNVTRAILATVRGSVDYQDRFEGELLPGQFKSIGLNYTNYENSSTNLSFTLEEFSDAERYLTLDSSIFQIPSSLAISPNGNGSIGLNVSLPDNASAGVYGGTLVAVDSSGTSIRIPVVLSVPLLGGGTASGMVNTGGVDGGDWIYIPIKPANTYGVSVNLSFTSGNLDAFMLAPNGETVGYSNGSSNPEVFSAYNLTYDTYWILVHARSVFGAVQFTLKLDYLSNFSINPSYWSGIYGGNATELNFTITNDDTAKENLNVSILQLESIPPQIFNFTYFISKSPASQKDSPIQNLSCLKNWFKKDLNVTLNRTRFIDINLTWMPAHDLDLYLIFWDDDGDGVFEVGEDHSTRYMSMFDNNQSGVSVETILQSDILYYYNKYCDLGISVCNVDNETDYSGNQTLSLTKYDHRVFPNATVNPNPINLTGNEQKNVTVSFNMSGMPQQGRFNLLMDAGGQALASIILEVGNPSTPTLANPSEIQNSSNLTFTWTQSQSTSPIQYYTLEQSQNFSFESTSGFNSTVNSLNITSPDGLYYFRVFAFDLNGLSSPESNIVNTTVDTIPPSAPQMISPTGETSQYVLELNWSEAADATSGVSHYKVQASFEPSFTNLTLEEIVNETTLNSSFQDGQHFARAAAVDCAGNRGPFGNTLNFTIKTLKLNEIAPGSNPWIELYNTRTESYNLSGWTLASSTSNTIVGGVIPAQGFLLVNSSQLNLTLQNDSITLKTPQAILIDNTSYSNLANESSLGRVENGVGGWIEYDSSTKTPGLSNFESHATTFIYGWHMISIPLQQIW